MELDLGVDQRNVFAGNTLTRFKAAAPFVFEGLKNLIPRLSICTLRNG